MLYRTADCSFLTSAAGARTARGRALPVRRAIGVHRFVPGNNCRGEFRGHASSVPRVGPQQHGWSGGAVPPDRPRRSDVERYGVRPLGAFGRLITSFTVDLSSCPLIETQPISSATNTAAMPTGTKNDVPRRSKELFSLGVSIFTFSSKRYQST